LSGSATTMGRMLGLKMASRLKDTQRTTASGVEPLFPAFRLLTRCSTYWAAPPLPNTEMKNRVSCFSSLLNF